MEEKRNAYRFLWESEKERDHSEDQGIDIKMDSRERGWGGMEWTFLAQDGTSGGIL
jgi:hypothetical protein